MISKRNKYSKRKRNSSKRKYNKGLYSFSKKSNKFVRNKFSVDPFDGLSKYGVIGAIFNKLGNKVTEPLIGDAAYSSTGNFYNPKKDSPYKGSFLYTLFYFGYKILAFVIVCFVLYLLKI